MVSRAMIGSLLRVVSTVTATLVLVGFGLFAIDEIRSGADAQLAQLEGASGPSPSAAGERAREQRQGKLREGIDDANDVLLAPFTELVDSDHAWVVHGFPALLGFLLYGVGLRLLAGYAPKPRPREPRGWRTA